MPFFWNSTKDQENRDRAKQEDDRTFAEIDGKARACHSAVDREKVLAELDEFLASAKKRLDQARSEDDRAYAADLHESITNVRREVHDLPRKRHADYERALETAVKKLRQEREAESSNLQNALAKAGVKEKVAELTARKQVLEQRLAEEAQEQKAAAETEAQIAVLQADRRQVSQEPKTTPAQPSEPPEGGNTFLGLRFGQRENNDTKPRRESGSETARSNIEKRISQVQHDSSSRRIKARKALEEAADRGAAETEVAADIEALAIANLAADERDKMKQELDAIVRDLPADEIALQKSEISIAITQANSDLDKRGDSVVDMDKLEKQIAALQQEMERKELHAEWDRLKTRMARRRSITPAFSGPPAAPPSAPPKPATWDSKEPDSPWCPQEIKPHLPYASECEKEYEHDRAMEMVLPNGWHAIGATRRGKMHAHRGTHREDAFRIELGRNFFIVCVCDGAGSYKYSRIGSETTCREVTRRLREKIEASERALASGDAQSAGTQLADMINLSVFETCKFLEELATKSECQPKDFRCTLLLTLMHRLGDSDIILSCGVGDGFIAGLDRDGVARRYGASDSGDFSGEVGCFIPDAPAPTKARDSIMSIKSADLEALIICSDGIEDPFYPLEKKAACIFKQLYCGVTEPMDGFVAQQPHGPVIQGSHPSAALSAWLAFEKKGENDDRTILVLHRAVGDFDPAKIQID